MKHSSNNNKNSVIIYFALMLFQSFVEHKGETSKDLYSFYYTTTKGWLKKARLVIF